MRIVAVLTLLLALSIPSRAQTDVDRLVSALDSLSTMKIEGWKVSRDLEGGGGITGNPAMPGFDDSQWDELRLDQRVYPDSCWIRKEITLPERILGRPVGGAVRLILEVDDYGYLWVNGEERGHFPWDGDFELTSDARPGQKFLVAIKAINTGGPLRLINAEIEPVDLRPLRRGIADFSTSLRVGQKLLGFDTYQTNARRKVDPGTDRSGMDRAEKVRLNELLQSLAREVDAGALASGDLDAFDASLQAVRGRLEPVSEFAKRFTLWFDANAHIDAAWLWREKETVEVCKNTFTGVLNMMDSRPDFTYTQSSAAYYDWMERLHPDVYRRIESRVKEGRWEITGGMWVEPDCNLPGGEAWMRHLLYGKRYFRQKFGKDVKIGYNPDSFGYNWNMPMFYADAGIDAFVTQKIGWSETNVFPHRLFWWEAPEGSRILAYFPFDYVNTIDNPYRIVDQLRQFESNTGVTQMLVLFGVGDHGGGPDDEMLGRLDRLKTLDIYPQVRLGTLADYVAWLKDNDLSKIPVWRDELYLEYHRGTYTTQSETKRNNRLAETRLTNAEKFSAIASRYGRPYRTDDLREAWQDVLFNQFHDILPGSSIREVYVDAGKRYEAAALIGDHETDNSLGVLADNINTSSFGTDIPVTVFNALNWGRTGPATVALPAEDGGGEREYGIFDETGTEVPSQIVVRDKYRRDLLFIARDIPPMGYRAYRLRARDNSVARGGATAVEVTGSALRNGILDVRIDTTTGWLASVRDLRDGREVLAGEGNRLQLLEDRPSAWDAWNIGLTGVEYPTRMVNIEVAERGPVRSTIRVTREYIKPGVSRGDRTTPDFPTSFFTQEISLYDGVDYVAFTTTADWWEEKTMVKVAFPVTVRDTAATYEIPYGTIRRSTQWRDSRDSARVEVSAQRWADLSDAGGGVSLLNRGKYGYDIKGSVMRLSLLRSPVWPDPTADRGLHEMEYALFPHEGSWREAGTVKRGYEYNNPLIARTGTASGGRLGLSGSFLGLSPDNLVLATVKQAEDGGAWIIQWYESAGIETEALLTLPAVPREVRESDFMEADRGAIPFEGRTVRVATKARGMRTLKVVF